MKAFPKVYAYLDSSARIGRADPAISSRSLAEIFWRRSSLGPLWRDPSDPPRIFIQLTFSYSSLRSCCLNRSRFSFRTSLSSANSRSWLWASKSILGCSVSVIRRSLLSRASLFQIQCLRSFVLVLRVLSIPGVVLIETLQSLLHCKLRHQGSPGIGFPSSSPRV